MSLYKFFFFLFISLLSFPYPLRSFPFASFSFCFVFFFMVNKLGNLLNIVSLDSEVGDVVALDDSEARDV